MKRGAALTLALASLLLLSFTATAQPSKGPDLVERMLGDYDLVITPELVDYVAELEGRGALAERLAEMSQDPSLSRYVRLRATSTLGYFPSPETRTLLLQLSQRSDDREVRVQAVRTLGYAFWEIDRETTERWLGDMAHHPDQKISATAARTLQKLSR